MNKVPLKNCLAEYQSDSTTWWLVDRYYRAIFETNDALMNSDGNPTLVVFNVFCFLMNFQATYSVPHCLF